MAIAGKVTTKLKVAIVRFPGSNCDFDCARVFERELGADVSFSWHTENTMPPADLIVIPGGFSFGDYLRSGALAAHAPVMDAVRAHAQRGGYILGICNGFQILTESGLLPGALLTNMSLKFICEQVEIINPDNEVFQMPIAHGEGRYYIDPSGLARLNDQNGVAFRYHGENPNGSVGGIAGVYSDNKRILGMMPHPERAAFGQLGQKTDGLKLLRKFINKLSH